MQHATRPLKKDKKKEKTYLFDKINLVISGDTVDVCQSKV